jgi:hypothetical protein
MLLLFIKVNFIHFLLELQMRSLIWIFMAWLPWEAGGFQQWPDQPHDQHWDGQAFQGETLNASVLLHHGKDVLKPSTRKWMWWLTLLLKIEVTWP